MEKTSQIFVYGTYQANGGMGTESQFDNGLNNAFYRFKEDGTYELLTSDYQKTGKWKYANDIFSIQINGAKEYQFEYNEIGRTW